MNKLSAEIDRQIKSGLIHGCVCGTLDRLPEAYGWQCLHPEKIPMSVNSRFDIASTGKVFTASCCAILASQGKLDPDAPFTEYMPEHVSGKNCPVTIRHLATHSSGFTNAKPYAKSTYDEFFREMMQMTPVWKAGEVFEYSCYNFIMLGLILNRITGKDLDTLARELIWYPLGMTQTTWNEPGNGPLEVEHHFPDRPAGVHNDPVCKMVNIPLGSGSCFSTCGDMLKFAGDMVEQKHFSKEYYKLLTRCSFETKRTAGFENDGSARRSFGWDMSDKRRPSNFSRSAVFHTGWTGQTIAISPEQGSGAVVMTSRTGDWEESNLGRLHLIDLLSDSGND